MDQNSSTDDQREVEYQKSISPEEAQRAREDAYINPETAEWLRFRYGPQVSRDQVLEHLQSLWDDAHTVCGPLWTKRQDSEEKTQRLEQKRMTAMLADGNQVFQMILVSKDPFERANLWRRLINQMKQMGGGIWKEVSKLYLCWFRTACLNRDASLEFNDESGAIEWNGIQLGVDQMKECVVQHIIREPIEQRLNMVRKCSQFFTLSNGQQQRLQTSIFSSGQLKVNQFVKLFRKALEFEVFGWTPNVNALHEAVE
jgi:hypothetical protein